MMRQYGEDIAAPVGNQPANRECQHDPNLLWSPSTRPFNVLIKPLVSDDARYNGLDPADPTGINEDNDYSPTGYIYYSGTGSLVQGGSILVNCTHGAASIVSGRDGKEGYYQFAVTDIDSLANCELSYTPPAGYRFDESCASGGSAFSVPTDASFTQLGSAKDAATGKLKDKACSSNPWYQRLAIAPDSGKLTNNNLPMTRGACSYDASLLRITGSFSGQGSTILSSALGIETVDDGSRVEVLAPHLLALKTPKLSIKSGTVLRVAAGARLSVAPVTDLCQ
ncbi:hypothetical protein [Thiolapillus sp.]|uniref:hypothetical protein n=1 Tax=Thiolapillus sp. TaxID=2017437 RepID=UPI0025D4F7FD|nr:hypothetical protein [Thiolapillus sp.]